MCVSMFLILFLMASNIAGQDLPYVLDMPSQSSVATKTPASSTFTAEALSTDQTDGQTEKEQIIRREDSKTDPLSDDDFITVEDLNDIDVHEVEPILDQTTKEIRDKFIETPTFEEEYNENNAKKEEHYSSTPDENMPQSSIPIEATKTPRVAMTLVTTNWLTLPSVYLSIYRSQAQTYNTNMHYYYDSSTEILEEENESLEADQEKPVDQQTTAEISSDDRDHMIDDTITATKKIMEDAMLHNLNATVVENLMETSLYIMHVTMDVLFKMMYNLMESMMSMDHGREVDRTKFNRTVKDPLVIRM
ncbi:uncharacterized protein LOC116415816 [Nasonia vitripennis]|uniref:Uncharacterized protein n=1 Tax=Nasonia vitripennis TaxID=7425 RepID=A0A7M7T673_NASVI|nr:uncharacterized protein LOC116415816 [Nasonia vitripennis]